MKRIYILIFAAAAVALLVGLVYVVLVVAHVSVPAATTVHGLTPRRLWATMVALLAVLGVLIGGVALVRSAGRFGGIVALVAGLIAAVNGALNLTIATGGPGTGNGVVGGAMAVVLGLVATVLGWLALARSRSHTTG